MSGICLPASATAAMFGGVEDIIQSRPAGFRMREELLRLHGGVQVTLEEATITGNLCVVESNLREIERRLARLIASPVPFSDLADDVARH